MRPIRFWLFLLISFCLAAVANAHVGSPGVIVQKQIGKYQLLVSIQPPDVVPGTARITVYVEQGRADSVRARPIFFASGDEGAPVYDELTRVAQNRFEGIIWLMDTGSSSAELRLTGPDGNITVVVPIMAVATALRTMPTETSLPLLVLGALLVILMITIIGASLADGTLAPGTTEPATFRRKRLVGMGIGALVLALALTGWRSWWTTEAQVYRDEQLYRPTAARATVSGPRNVAISFDTTGFGQSRQKRRRFSYMLPDHGKLMHSFLVRVPGLDAFAHLHPVRRDTLRYEATLPPLPAGRYLLFSDIVHRSGLAETLIDTVQIPAVSQLTASQKPSDRDDSWLVAKPMGIKASTETIPPLDNDMAVCGKPGASTKLADGSTMLWMDKPGRVLETGRLYTLKFAVADQQGKATPLEPYLGMSGHAVIMRSDGSVYIHLHPIGTYSMAAEESLVERIADTARTFRYPNAVQFRDSIDAYVARLNSLPEAEKNRLLMATMPAMNHAMKTNNMVQFPYAFPQAGHYRIWVQVRRAGQVLTGVFDTEVTDSLL